GKIRGQKIRRWTQNCLHSRLPRSRVRLIVRQMDTILFCEFVVDWFGLKARGDKKTQKVGNHQRDDDGVIAGDFEDHYNAGHRRANNSGEGGAHADEGVGARAADVSGNHAMSDRANDAAEHRSEKKTGAKDAAGVAGGVADDDGEKLQDKQQDHDAQRELAIERFADVYIADAENLRDEPTRAADNQPANDRMEPRSLARKGEEFLSQPQEQAAERNGNQSTDYSEDRVRDKFDRMNELIFRDLEERGVAKKDAENGPRSCGGKNHGAEYGRMQVTDDFFEGK